MKLLEHQAKALLARYGVPVPRGRVLNSASQVPSVWDELTAEGQGLVLKAQVPTGRRGKAGGVVVTHNLEEAQEVAARLLGTKVAGFEVGELLAEELVPTNKELYVSVLTDTSPASPWPLIMVSAAGGIEVEELLERSPELLHRTHADPAYGLHAYQARELARKLSLEPEVQGALVNVLGALYRAYWENDAELVEINPLAVTGEGTLVALDAKVSIDNAARFRHPDLRGAEIESVESRAASMGLSYVQLDGDIGLISNGAGLTMATMDHLALLGGRPANFLDTGERILRGGIPDGLGILLANPNVKVVLINVFGGGVRCDVIAEKIVEAVKSLPEGHVPIVVTLHGRNDTLGREIVRQAELAGVEITDTIEEALVTAVALAQAAGQGSRAEVTA